MNPLTDEQKKVVIGNAIMEFSEFGFEKTDLEELAEKSQVGIEQIEDAFQDKEGLFTACVTESLSYMDSVFAKAKMRRKSIGDVLESLIEQVQVEAREHPEYFRLYLQLTAITTKPQSREIVNLIESSTARMYLSIFKEAKRGGLIREDIDLKLFSFYFDNMIMMLHFAYCCDYFEERFKVFCGEDIMEKDELVRQEMMKFLGGAFGLAE